MLQAIRDRSQGLIVAIIVGFISLTFALWGVESYINEGRRVVVAEVDGEEIFLTEFQVHLQNFRRQAQSVLGDAFDDTDWNSPEVTQQALEQMVNDRIVARLVDDARLRITDMQVAQQLQQIPAFQDENGFSRTLYEQRLPALGMSQAEFERRLREDMAKAQLRAGVAGSTFVTREEAVLIERLREQKRDIGYSVIPASAFAEQVELSEADVEAHFEAQREQYREPARVRLAYIEISASALEDEVEVSEPALRDYYDNNAALYTEPERRNVNHILISVPAGADETARDAALAKARETLRRARAGEPFEELVEELSDDVGSRAEGGETGLFARGVMAPEFEQAAFALEVGEFSEPVRTEFGYHIIRLKDIDEGGLAPFDAVREKVESAYRTAEAQKLYFDLADQFSNLVYEHPDSLEVAAEALDLEIQRTDLLSEAEIAREFSDEVAARAFEPEVLLEGLNAEPVELDDGRVIAIRVSEHKPAHVPRLEEIRDEVAEAARSERERALTEAAAREMVERLRDGATVAEVVEAEGFGWEKVVAAGRDSRDVNRAVLRAAFRTEVEGGGPVYTSVPIGKSDYAVVRVANVATPSADALERGDVAAVRQELLDMRAVLTWQEFIDVLRAQSDVKIYAENL